MKNLISGLCIFLISCTFVGCIDIVEEISMNKKGSGTYKINIDFTDFMAQMEGMSAFDTTGQMLVQIQRSLDSVFSVKAEEYKKIEGVKNVGLDKTKKSIYNISFDFSDVAALNKVMALDAKEKPENTTIYSWEKGKLKRNSQGLAALGGVGDLTGSGIDIESMKGYLEKLTFKVIVKLPGKIKEIDNKSALTAQDKTGFTIDTNFKELIEKNVDLNYSIKYK
jgi:hypothetical protein